MDSLNRNFSRFFHLDYALQPGEQSRPLEHGENVGRAGPGYGIGDLDFDVSQWSDRKTTVDPIQGTVHGPWGGGSGGVNTVYRTLRIDPTATPRLRFKLRYWALDSWDDERAYFSVGGQNLWSAVKDDKCLAPWQNAGNQAPNVPDLWEGVGVHRCYIDVDVEYEFGTQVATKVAAWPENVWCKHYDLVGNRPASAQACGQACNERQFMWHEDTHECGCDVCKTPTDQASTSNPSSEGWSFYRFGEAEPEPAGGLLVEITADLNQGAEDESWAFSAFEVSAPGSTTTRVKYNTGTLPSAWSNTDTLEDSAGDEGTVHGTWSNDVLLVSNDVPVPDGATGDVTVSLRFWSLDSWDDETGRVWVNSAEIWSMSRSWQSCGGFTAFHGATSIPSPGHQNRRCYADVAETVPVASVTRTCPQDAARRCLLVAVGAQLDGDDGGMNDESWGFSRVEVTFDVQHSVDLTPTDTPVANADYQWLVVRSSAMTVRRPQTLRFDVLHDDALFCKEVRADGTRLDILSMQQAYPDNWIWQSVVWTPQAGTFVVSCVLFNAEASYGLYFRQDSAGFSMCVSDGVSVPTPAPAPALAAPAPTPAPTSAPAPATLGAPTQITGISPATVLTPEAEDTEASIGLGPSAEKCPNDKGKTYSSFGTCFLCDGSAVPAVNSSSDGARHDDDPVSPSSSADSGVADSSSSSSSPSSSSSATSSADVRWTTLLACVGVLVAIFCVAFVGVVLAKRKHAGTLGEGFHRSRELVVFVCLSFQTAAFVGPVRRVAGVDAITDLHRVAFGVYETISGDTSAVMPPDCLDAQDAHGAAPTSVQGIVCMATLVLWASTLLALRLHLTAEQGRQRGLSRVRFCVTRRSVDILSVLYGPVCSVVFFVLSGWHQVGLSEAVLAWSTLFAYCLGFPAATFWYLRGDPGGDRGGSGDGSTNMDGDGDATSVAGSRRRQTSLAGMVKHFDDNHWAFRHLHLVVLFCLALDRRVFSIGLSATSQIISTIVGFTPCMWMLVLLARRRRFLVRHAWMGWTRCAIMVQVGLGYVVKAVGFFTLGEANRDALVFLSYVWVSMYGVTVLVLLAGFGYCLMAGAKHAAEERQGRAEEVAEQTGSDPVELEMTTAAAQQAQHVNPMHARRQNRQPPQQQEEHERGGGGSAGHPQELDLQVCTTGRPQRPSEAAVEDGDELPPGVVECVDPDSGQAYYYNELTRSSSWERPQSRSARTLLPPEPVNVSSSSKLGRDWIHRREISRDLNRKQSAERMKTKSFYRMMFNNKRAAENDT